MLGTQSFSPATKVQARLTMRDKPTEVELIEARLTRMKYLLDALATQLDTTDEVREQLQKLRRELELTRTAVRINFH